MDLVERYLAAERRCGRPPCAAHLSAELRGLLVARLEAREATLRRPLRTDEAVAEIVDFARRLLSESRVVMRRLEDACLGLRAPAEDISEGGSCGPR
jgi:hypothetical protein